ncbi:MAG: RHS repeat-associated core domain-containing protein, partial [Acidobacteriota bacterium]
FTFDWDPGTGAITERWALRDLDGSVLTVYETEGGNAGTWRWTQDYVYRDGTMLASRVRFDDGSIGVRDTVVDHLGTPRLIGDRFNGLRTQHVFGFGEPTDLAASIGDPERKRFTGHERDLGTLSGAGGVQVELDSMHARFYSPWTARFLSVDPARASVRLQRPQTWNRFSYAYNNPVTLVDPDGRVPILFKTAVKLAIKGGDIAATTAGIVADAKTLASPDASSDERMFAAASLASEVLSPFSVRDIKSGMNAADMAGDAASGTGRAVDAADAVQGVTANGQLSRLGRAGKGKGIRLVHGDAHDARGLFDQLRGTNPVTEVKPGVFIARGRSGGTVTFRSVSKSGPPTIDVHGVEEAVRKIKFVSE